MSSSPTTPNGPRNSSFTDEVAAEAIDVERVLRALADDQRREILAVLDYQPEVSRATLLDRLYEGLENPTAPKARIETALVHKHLPALQQADLVDLDDDAWRVQRGDSFPVVRAMADAAATVVRDR